MADHTTPSDATLAEEEKEAKEPSGAGDLSGGEDADGHTVDPDVAAAEKAANARGANVKGEGQLP